MSLALYNPLRTTAFVEFALNLDKVDASFGRPSNRSSKAEPQRPTKRLLQRLFTPAHDVPAVDDEICRSEPTSSLGPRESETADVPIPGTGTDLERRALVCTIELALSGTHAARLTDGTREYRLEPVGTGSKVLVWAEDSARPYEADSAEDAVNHVLAQLSSSAQLYLRA